MTSKSNDKQENTPTPAAALRVLIADDHPVVRSGVRNELAAHADLQVVGEAVDGDEVLARVRNGKDLRHPHADAAPHLDIGQFRRAGRQSLVGGNRMPDANAVVDPVA